MVTDPITAYLTTLGFPQIMLWLLSFAALYGLMSQASVPKDKPSRAIISIVAAFFVILATPTALIEVIERMSTSLILVVLGILLIIVFLEVAGIKAHVVTRKQTKEGVKEEVVAVPIFERYGTAFALIFIIIAVLIFIGAGGLNLLGFNISLTGVNTMTILFFIVIILAVMWMIFERGG
ncbi:MAG: hypothetical protein ACE5J7_00140 [Candidatus Aenigmatarchaeota archaeon]